MKYLGDVSTLDKCGNALKALAKNKKQNNRDMHEKLKDSSLRSMQSLNSQPLQPLRVIIL